jgi:hypothetical protein
MQLTEIVARIAMVEPSCGPVRVIAVDGGAGAGKSTLAATLAEALPMAAVFHLDELLDGWNGQFSYRDRLRAQVLAPLAENRPARYQRYDWLAGRFTDWVSIPVPRILIVEGVSAIWGCEGALALGVFLNVGRMERLRRWIERDGPAEPEWLRWLDAEEAFFGRHPTPPESLML